MSSKGQGQGCGRVSRGVIHPPANLETQGSVCREVSDPDAGLGFRSTHTTLSGTQQPLDGPDPGDQISCLCEARLCGPEALCLIQFSLLVALRFKGIKGNKTRLSPALRRHC